LNNYLQDIENAKEILGNDILECLKNIFIHLDGEPPRVQKKRYRANNLKHMVLLDTLQHEYQFIYIERIENKDFYLLKSYALPLIETNKSKTLLQAMSEIYSLLPALYSERLDESVLVEELFEISNLKKDIFLEALFYLFEYHNIWTGKTLEFPYKKGSSFQISEKVLLNEFLQTATDYYRWNILNNKQNISLPDKEPHITRGRPSKKMMIEDAFKKLDAQGKINRNQSTQSNYSNIRNSIKILYPEADDKGLSDETIRRTIRKYF
jgi:hypothetical protein